MYINSQGGTQYIRTVAEKLSDKKTKQVLIRLNPYELDKLDYKVRKAKLTRSEYIRSVLRGEEVKEAPPLEFKEFNIEMRRVGNNLNQIARKLNVNNPEERPAVLEVRKAISDLYDVLGKIYDSYISQPKKNES